MSTGGPESWVHRGQPGGGDHWGGPGVWILWARSRRYQARQERDFAGASWEAGAAGPPSQVGVGKSGTRPCGRQSVSWALEIGLDVGSSQASVTSQLVGAWFCGGKPRRWGRESWPDAEEPGAWGGGSRSTVDVSRAARRWGELSAVVRLAPWAGREPGVFGGGHLELGLQGLTKNLGRRSHSGLWEPSRAGLSREPPGRRSQPALRWTWSLGSRDPGATIAWHSWSAPGAWCHGSRSWPRSWQTLRWVGGCIRGTAGILRPQKLCGASGAGRLSRRPGFVGACLESGGTGLAGARKGPGSVGACREPTRAAESTQSWAGWLWGPPWGGACTPSTPTDRVSLLAGRLGLGEGWRRYCEPPTLFDASFISVLHPRAADPPLESLALPKVFSCTIIHIDVSGRDKR